MELISREAAIAAIMEECIAPEGTYCPLTEQSIKGAEEATVAVAVDAIRSIPAQAPAVKVKPLVWVDGDDDDSLVTIGSLLVYIVGYGAEDTTCGLYMDDGCHLGNFHDEEAAKAAAQADYEARILSELDLP